MGHTPLADVQGAGKHVRPHSKRIRQVHSSVSEHSRRHQPPPLLQRGRQPLSDHRPSARPEKSIAHRGAAQRQDPTRARPHPTAATAAAAATVTDHAISR